MVSKISTQTSSALRTAFTFFALSIAAMRSMAQVSVTATGGTTGPTAYTTLKGAFDAVNAGTHTGSINISISANTTETATAQLNSSGTGSASYIAVRIKPAAGTQPVVSGAQGAVSGSLTTLIRLQGADSVLFDGSNTVGGTTRDLTFTNTAPGFNIVNNTIGNNAVIGLIAASATDGANNNAIRNCNISGGAAGAGAVTVGVYSGSATATGLSGLAPCNNNTVQNNAITRAANGIYIFGWGTTPFDAGWNIIGNTLGSTNTADYLHRRGMLVYNASNFTIADNIATGVYSIPTDTFQSIGMQVGGGMLNGSIVRNRISNLRQTNNTVNLLSTYIGAFGIEMVGSNTGSNVTIANNFISDISSYGHSSILSQGGIYLATGNGYNIYHNSVSMATNPGLSTAYTLGIVMAGAVTGMNIRNNIFSNTQTSGTRLAIYTITTNTAFTAINGNDYYSTGTWLGYLSGFQTTLANWQTATGQDANSKNILPVFTSLNDLHLPPASNTTLDNQGIPGTGITADIDGDARNASTPDIGADEFSLCPPIAFTQPASTTACIGGAASFTAASTSATAFQWQLNTGSGWTNITNNATYSGATTATLTITGATTAMNNYQYRAYATSACANDTSAIAILTVSPVPASPTVTSNSPVCGGGTITLTASAVATGGTVTWSGPVSYSAVGNPVSRTNVTPAMSGAYSATTTVAGCASLPTSTSVTVNPTPVISSATPTNPTTCGGTNGFITLTGLAVSTVYITTYSKNGVGQSAVGLTSDLSGNLVIPALGNGTYTAFVVSTAGCSSAPFAGPVTLNGPGTPTQPTAITGPTTGCIGGAGQTYSVPVFTGATYTWTLPPGWTGSSTTNSITATAGAGAGAGTISVTATNTCGTSAAQTLAVNVATPPVAPNGITGSAANCSGVPTLFSTQPVAGATGYVWTLPSGWTGTSSTFSISATPGVTGGVVTVAAQNTCGTSATASFPVTSNQTVAPAVSISPSTPTTICAGTSVTFTAVPTNGGPTPQYHWLKNGVSTGTYTTTYANSSLAAGDVITLTMTSSAPCALPSPTVSSTLAMTVQANTLAGVTISAGFPGPPVVCAGQPVTFVAAPIGGGTTPTYSWRLNGATVGTNTPTYTNSSLTSNDSVWCVLTSSAQCALPQPASSNKIRLQVVTTLAPSVAVTVSPDTLAPAGSAITFTAATVVGDGPTPGYQWMKNGIPIGGATSASYTTTAWTTGDKFLLRMVSSAPCAAPGVVMSNALRMTATAGIGGAAGALAAGLSVWPNPNSGAFTLALHNAEGAKRTRIDILNALGQTVWTREVIVDKKEWSTDVTLGMSLSNGIYMLRLTGEDGSRSTERFELRR